MVGRVRRSERLIARPLGGDALDDWLQMQLEWGLPNSSSLQERINAAEQLKKYLENSMLKACALCKSVRGESELGQKCSQCKCHLHLECVRELLESTIASSSASAVERHVAERNLRELSTGFENRSGSSSNDTDVVWTCPICTGAVPCLVLLRQRVLAKVRQTAEQTERQVRKAFGANIVVPRVPAHVACAMCKETTDNVSTGVYIQDQHNAMVGPYHGKYVHEECATWAPQVYFHKRHRALIGVAQELTRASQLFCSFCRRQGAALGCQIKDCNASFHVRCARRAGCYLDPRKSTLLCVEHTVSHMVLPLVYDPVCRHPELRYDCAPPRPPRHYTDVTQVTRPLSRADAYLKFLRQSGVPQLPVSTRKKKRKRGPRRQRQPALLTLQTGGQSRRHRPKQIVPTQVPWHTPGLASLGGLSAQKRALRETVLLPLLYPDLLRDLSVTAPRGVLLHGPPGTGKTSLVRALVADLQRALSVRVDGTASGTGVQTTGGTGTGTGDPEDGCTRVPGVTFFARSASDVLSPMMGDSEVTLRALFRAARQQAPALVFFDEIDALCPRRSAKQAQVHSSLVATLLAEMDGVGDRGHVIVIAATNRPDAIDDALRRPGRFDREVEVPLPNENERRRILEKLLSTVSGGGVSREMMARLARDTVGHSGADLKGMCAAASLKAVVRHDSDSDRGLQVTEADLLQALRQTKPSCVRGGTGSVKLCEHVVDAELFEKADALLELPQLRGLALPSVVLNVAPRAVFLSGLCEDVVQALARRVCHGRYHSWPFPSVAAALNADCPEEELYDMFRLVLQEQQNTLLWLPDLAGFYHAATPALQTMLTEMLQDCSQRAAPLLVACDWNDGSAASFSSAASSFSSFDSLLLRLAVPVAVRRLFCDARLLLQSARLLDDTKTN